ncbi:MAG: GNAT family N-acetyltransferase [Ignavibacteria bacterium]|nr:GNAT family N-acetyltransferase [Ignavibacteria bacterium]
MDIHILPLNESTLHATTVLRDTIFTGLNRVESETLRTSLSPENYHIRKKLAISELAYWTAIDPLTQNVVGLVGLYTENDDEDDTVWLGWYCVDSRYRGHKIGSKLLELAINEAKAQNKKYLNLYTTTDDEYATACVQYEKIGFKHYKSEKKNLFYRLFLMSS